MNNKGLIICIIMLTILVLGLVGYIVYDKILKDNNIVENINNGSETVKDEIDNETKELILSRYNNMEEFKKALNNAIDEYFKGIIGDEDDENNGAFYEMMKEYQKDTKNNVDYNKLKVFVNEEDKLVVFVNIATDGLDGYYQEVLILNN